jgi:hypothetical protein
MVTICSPRGIKWEKNHPHRVWRGRVWYPIPRPRYPRGPIEKPANIWAHGIKAQ